MAETFTRWDLADHLRSKEDARLYLEACAEEDPGDGSLIRAALNDIARAGHALPGALSLLGALGDFDDREIEAIVADINAARRGPALGRGDAAGGGGGIRTHDRGEHPR